LSQVNYNVEAYKSVQSKDVLVIEMARLQKQLKRELDLRELSNEALSQLSRRLKTMEEQYEKELADLRQVCEELKENAYIERLGYEKKLCSTKGEITRLHKIIQRILNEVKNSDNILLVRISLDS